MLPGGLQADSPPVKQINKTQEGERRASCLACLQNLLPLLDAPSSPTDSNISDVKRPQLTAVLLCPS